MNHIYSGYVQKHLDILSLRDLAPGTISTYISYLNEFLSWVAAELHGKDPVKGKTMRELILYLFNRDICECPSCKSTMLHLAHGVPLTYAN